MADSNACCCDLGKFGPGSFAIYINQGLYCKTQEISSYDRNQLELCSLTEGWVLGPLGTSSALSPRGRKAAGGAAAAGRCTLVLAKRRRTGVYHTGCFKGF